MTPIFSQIMYASVVLIHLI